MNSSEDEGHAPHELDKLDVLLGLPIGTSRSSIVRHLPPQILNSKLAKYGIILDEYGMVAKDQREAWRSLMIEAGVSSRYWKNKDLLVPDAIITTLE